ncbi:MAG: FMN-binding glutamate synthase family protein, partial [Gammaproteobacteria bacterium]|nr:FMN-binding glutamate synthase family protein [Gammaproteobacteria bacterium]
VYNLHRATVHAFNELCGAMGYDNPALLKPGDIVSRYDAGYRYFDEIHPPILPGQLLDDSAPQRYLNDWHRATPESF